ncbi:hypothetical protein F8M41_008492 [Gigaspora margarita]|uniref:Uncharacterized protein n=1 Tax=Gigaspora margarita TaxID=4874 RepID=A0A8H3X4V1_GIGMA|nr:hypothetical protein F8M41_008492 [Gigaspora margarita]
MSDIVTDLLDNHELSQQDSFEILSKKGLAHTITTAKNYEPEQNESHIEVNYLDLGDLIEQEIQELTIGAQTDGVASIIYQTHLIVVTTIHRSNFLSAEMSKKFGDIVGWFYYFCCQSKEAQSENYKDSNRKRRTHYDCKGKINIQADLVLNTAVVDIYHGSKLHNFSSSFNQS